MMKIMLVVFLAVCITSVAFALKSTTRLVIDALNVDKFPRNFRTTSDDIDKLHLLSTMGLASLHVMGSAQFSEKELLHILKKFHRPYIIIDLRQESHGFIDGTAISWYARYNWANVRLTETRTAQLEKQLLQQLQIKAYITADQITEKKRGRVKKVEPLTLKVQRVQDEQQLLTQHGLQYIRLYITDHRKPPDQQVNRFIEIVKTIPQQQWLYIHCRGGKGRTTIFMAMRDMMTNAKQVSFEEIVQRQFVLGGQNLYKMPAENEKTHLYAIERLEFLKKFYDYCKNNHDNFATKWKSS